MGTPHRYWRLNILSNNGGGSTGTNIAELQLRTAVGGSSVATGGTASSQTLWAGSAAAAFDGNTGTAWEGASHSTDWLKYDFGAGNGKDIVEIAITASGSTWAPNTADVQWSDDNSIWVTAYSITGQTAWGASETRVFSFAPPAYPGSARYWRILVLAVNGKVDGSTGFKEVELRTSIGGSDVTGSGTASADSGTAANAFDNNSATEWGSSTAGLPHWLKYDFGSGNDKNIVEMNYTTRNAAAQQPIDFDLQWSLDNNVWVSSIAVRGYADADNNGGTGTFSANTGVMAATTGNKEAWRINVSANNGNTTVWTAAEVEMYVTGNTDQCNGGAAFASTVYDAVSPVWSPSRAFDNSATATSPNIYSAGINTGWLAYKFPSSKNIAVIGIKSRSDAGTENQAPKNFTVEYWDGTAWQVAMTLTNITSWSTGQWRYFNASGETSAPSAVAARPVVFVCC